MNRAYAHDEIAKPAAIKRKTGTVSSHLDVVADPIEKPQEAGLSIVLGRVVQSAKYGKGYVAKIEDEAVKIRFWRHGYKTFRATEAGYAFESIDAIRPVNTPAEKPEDYCLHGENQPFCCRCTGLSDIEIEQWKEYRSNERRIALREGSKRYTSVIISTNDCVLTSRCESKVSSGVISDWYECLACGRTIEIAASKGNIVECAVCHGALIPVGEPFQTAQFSPRIHEGAKGTKYADAEPIPKASCSEEAINVTALYADPNSRFQKGGTGFIRIPLDEPRSTRADAPEWLDRRQDFFKALKPSRAARAEQILSEFYLGYKTDTQIAGTLGWGKDSVKKERSALLQGGNRFFAIGGATPP